jgi:predicted dinucleotide-binding enzyme
MKFAVLGTGMVGQTIATKLVSLGHEVTMGSRTEGNVAAAGWVKAAGDRASQGSFEQAAAAGESIFNCTAGTASLDALRSAGAANLAGKLLVDVANPLDFSKGMPPALSVCNGDSLAEQIQREFGEASVVKTLNTVNCEVMVEPSIVPGAHNIFVCGNEDKAKLQVRELLESFGWPPQSIVDLGDITAARGMEMYLPLWVKMFGTLGTGRFNIAIAS